MITKFFKAIPTPQTSGSGYSPPTLSSFPSPTIHDNINHSARLNKEKMLNLNLELDPAERKQISEYPPNLRDQVRRHYIQQAPCQPCNCRFPKRYFGGFMRQFNLEWFNTSYSGWLEYSVKVDAAFCLCCYLFKNEHRGHGKVEDSFTKSDRDDEVKKVVLQSAPQNNMMIAPNIQKKIVNACAKEIMKAIVEDLNGDYFGILVDESKDVSHKEQMALVLRYVNKEEHSLSPSQIRGQGYDGASNMQGEINGLKTLILKDNPSAYCIHYFAHQLQLTLVVVAKKHCDVDQFFDIVANVLNIVGSSFKRRDMLREDQAKKLEELQVLGEVHTRSGLNQELGLQRPGDTRWGSHFKTVRNFITLFSSIINVLEFLASEGANYLERSVAKSLVNDIRSFEFVHMMHLMLKLLAITNDLNMALQRKDQDIVNAMKLVGFAKR
ncbi:uncharacterized protein LOC107768775 [Nicotiana tabacum]|uniref:Uncharacterized protein LOC107768775 n=1 Tax=Nicotiana tabacum TaxID=4097 RepID=A0AC58U638_TOBAC